MLGFGRLLRAPIRGALVIGAIAALAWAPGALAHAELESSTPASDALLRRAPSRVALRFSEPLESAFASVRVYDRNARRVDHGKTTRPEPEVVATGLLPDLPRGTYTVAWRVVSEDSHPIDGAFVFHVGRQITGATGAVDEAVDEGSGSGAVDTAFWVVRFLSLTFILLGVGGAIALAVVLTGEDRRVRRPLWVVLALASALLAVAALAGIGVEGAKASALGLDAAFRPSLVRDVLDTRFGEVWLLRAVAAGLLAVVAVLAARRATESRVLVWSAVALGALIAATPALAGHARADGGLAVASDWAHVLAGAAWAGGLAFLLVALLRGGGERWGIATRSVPRFSALAVAAIALLLVAGVVNGIYEVGSWSGLWETTYGRLLLVKVALVVPILGLGVFNNRVSTPRLRDGVASALERRRFLLSTGAELAIALVVVGVTAALVAEPPAKAQLAAQSGSVTRDAFAHPFAVEVVVDPAHTGSNEIHVHLLDHLTGRPANVGAVAVSASLPAAGIGPMRLEAAPAGPGESVVPEARFPVAGLWTLRLDIGRSSANVTVPIAGDT